MTWRATGADVASVCTLTCKWNYLAHENRFSKTLLDKVGLSDLPAKVPAAVHALGTPAGTAFGRGGSSDGLAAGHSGGDRDHRCPCRRRGADRARRPKAGSRSSAATSSCHMVVSRDPVMVPGVWGPYFGAMLPGTWLNEGGQSATGALIDWSLRQCDAWPELEREARGGDVFACANAWVADLEAREAYPTRELHVLGDHHGNRSPRADPLARGAVVGLTLETGRDALARRYLATLEAVAYGTRHIIDELEAAGHRIERIVACGGGTKNPLWLRTHADATGRDIHLVADEDAVTLGAAILCGGVERQLCRYSCRGRRDGAAGRHRERQTHTPARFTTPNIPSISASMTTCAAAASAWPNGSEHELA